MKEKVVVEKGDAEAVPERGPVKENQAREAEEEQKHDHGHGQTLAVKVGADVGAEDDALGIFGKYLSVWVLLCMALGTGIALLFPAVPRVLDEATVAHISTPVAVLLWIMIFPMTLKIDLQALKDVVRFPKGIIITTTLNWCVQPFLMFGLAVFWFQVAFRDLLSSDTRQQYVAGAVILGGSPCTAMVFAWTALAGGNAAYALVQVAINDVLILVLYAPTLFLLLSSQEDIHIPYATIALSVVLFVVVPFGAGFATRLYCIRTLGTREGETRLRVLEARWKPATIVALLITLVVIFIFQGERMVRAPVQVLMIAVPLTLQTYIVFALAFGAAYLWRVPFPTAAPCGFISSSNFFELAVGVAVAAYGLGSGATLATVVGVLTEVPIMLSLVWIAKKLKHHFPSEEATAIEDGDSTPSSRKDLQDASAKSESRRDRNEQGPSGAGEIAMIESGQKQAL